MSILSDKLEKIHKIEESMTEDQKQRYIKTLVSKFDNVWELIHKNVEYCESLVVNVVSKSNSSESNSD